MTGADSWQPTIGRGIDLRELFSRVLRARAALTADLNLPAPQPHLTRTSRAHLIAALESYAAALSASRLPVPHSIRDELRLQRSVASLRGPGSQRHSGSAAGTGHLCGVDQHPLPEVRPHSGEERRGRIGDRRRRVGDRRGHGDRRAADAGVTEPSRRPTGSADRRRRS